MTRMAIPIVILKRMLEMGVNKKMQPVKAYRVGPGKRSLLSLHRRIEKQRWHERQKYPHGHRNMNKCERRTRGME